MPRDEHDELFNGFCLNCEYPLFKDVDGDERYCKECLEEEQLRLEKMADEIERTTIGGVL